MPHVTSEQLVERVASLPTAPVDSGTVQGLVIRPAKDKRKRVDQIQVRPGEGVVGDNYLERGNSKTADGKAHPEAQVAIMNASILNVIADGDRDLWELAGDQLLVDFDLCVTNLPAGSRFSIGTAVFEVSNKPHNGCAKFAERFGIDAARFANSDREQRYRGINLMVVTGGQVNVGDTITKLNETGTGSFPLT